MAEVTFGGQIGAADDRNATVRGDASLEYVANAGDLLTGLTNIGVGASQMFDDAGLDAYTKRASEIQRVFMAGGKKGSQSAYTTRTQNAAIERRKFIAENPHHADKIRNIDMAVYGDEPTVANLIPYKTKQQALATKAADFTVSVSKYMEQEGLDITDPNAVQTAEAAVIAEQARKRQAANLLTDASIQRDRMLTDPKFRDEQNVVALEETYVAAARAHTQNPGLQYADALKLGKELSKEKQTEEEELKRLEVRKQEAQMNAALLAQKVSEGKIAEQGRKQDEQKRLKEKSSTVRSVQKIAVASNNSAILPLRSIIESVSRDTSVASVTEASSALQQSQSARAVQLQKIKYFQLEYGLSDDDVKATIDITNSQFDSIDTLLKTPGIRQEAQLKAIENKLQIDISDSAGFLVKLRKTWGNNLTNYILTTEQGLNFAERVSKELFDDKKAFFSDQTNMQKFMKAIQNNPAYVSQLPKDTAQSMLNTFSGMLSTKNPEEYSPADKQMVKTSLTTLTHAALGMGNTGKEGFLATTAHTNAREAVNVAYGDSRGAGEVVAAVNSVAVDVYGKGSLQVVNKFNKPDQPYHLRMDTTQGKVVVVPNTAMLNQMPSEEDLDPEAAIFQTEQESVRLGLEEKAKHLNNALGTFSNFSEYQGKMAKDISDVDARLMFASSFGSGIPYMEGQSWKAPDGQQVDIVHELDHETVITDVYGEVRNTLNKLSNNVPLTALYRQKTTAPSSTPQPTPTPPSTPKKVKDIKTPTTPQEAVVAKEEGDAVIAETMETEPDPVKAVEKAVEVKKQLKAKNVETEPMLDPEYITTDVPKTVQEVKSRIEEELIPDIESVFPEEDKEKIAGKMEEAVNVLSEAITGMDKVNKYSPDYDEGLQWNSLKDVADTFSKLFDVGPGGVTAMKNTVVDFFARKIKESQANTIRMSKERAGRHQMKRIDSGMSNLESTVKGVFEGVGSVPVAVVEGLSRFKEHALSQGNVGPGAIDALIEDIQRLPTGGPGAVEELMKILNEHTRMMQKGG